MDIFQIRNAAMNVFALNYIINQSGQKLMYDKKNRNFVSVVVAQRFFASYDKNINEF